ncbi:MAG TPA: pyruvate formate lyase family protein, partial [Clostridia bacterium]|nr:pyruvate formate lyase family protein [Clostridia bacterium]
MEAKGQESINVKPNEYFGSLNERAARIRARLLETQPSVCTERAVLTTQAYRAHEQDQVVLRRAYMLDQVLRNMTVYIDPDALLAGNQAVFRFGSIELVT